MAPLGAARHVKVLFFGMLIIRLSVDVFSWHVTLLAIVIGHGATPRKCGAVKDKLFPAFISRRSLQCSHCYDKHNSLSFLKARRSAARWGHSFKVYLSRRRVFSALLCGHSRQPEESRVVKNSPTCTISIPKNRIFTRRTAPSGATFGGTVAYRLKGKLILKSSNIYVWLTFQDI